jgi:hypothetical protein
MRKKHKQMFEALGRQIEVTQDVDELLDIINAMRSITGEPPAVMSDDFIDRCINIYENSKIERNQ